MLSEKSIEWMWKHIIFVFILDIPVSLSYIQKLFSTLHLSNKGFDGDRYGLFEIVRKARFCNLYTLLKHVLFASPP